jgi:hypothetical protein
MRWDFGRRSGVCLLAACGARIDDGGWKMEGCKRRVFVASPGRGVTTGVRGLAGALEGGGWKVEGCVSTGWRRVSWSCAKMEDGGWKMEGCDAGWAWLRRGVE